MKSLFGILFIVCSQTASALTVLNSKFIAETYCTYANSAGLSRGMTFDFDGNLYITYSNRGTIDRIGNDKAITRIANGMSDPRGLTWTGGSAYGNNLYVAEAGTHRIKKVSLDGNVSTFCSLSGGIQSLEVDRSRRYGGFLYAGTRDGDHIDKITPQGAISSFSDFPYGMRGGPTDIAFDPGIAYGGLMFVTTDSTLDVSWKGLHTLDINGNPTQFVHKSFSAHFAEFDGMGLFGGKLFISADNDGVYSILEVSTTGQMTEFISATISPAHTFAFGPDGCMYVHEYTADTSIITRISPIPEPATLALLGIGGLLLRRRR